MHKSTKIWANYLIGAAVSFCLLWFILRQVQEQLHSDTGSLWLHTGPNYYLLFGVAFMLINILLESSKWYLLANAVTPTPFSRTFASYLAGMAFSIATPNRTGDYPARILYLAGDRALRYIYVSVLGAASQLSATFIGGLIPLIYYNLSFPGTIAKISLAIGIGGIIVTGVVYWRLGKWVPRLARIKWLRWLSVYDRQAGTLPQRQQIVVLCISVLRFGVVTAQYLFLLWWMNVDVPIASGLCLAALFFWTLAVIPSIALAELGIRGAVSIYIFQHCTHNTVGVIAATMAIWLLNLIIPSVFGSVLMLRMRLLR